MNLLHTSAGFPFCIPILAVSCALAISAPLGAQCDRNEEQILRPSGGGSTGAAFGRSVSIRGDLAVVGSFAAVVNGTKSGAATVFRHNGSQWVQDQTLVPSDAPAHAWFGFSVAASADLVVIGAPHDKAVTDSQGSVYVFRYSGGSWAEEQKFTVTDGARDGGFGRSVALSGNRALIGTPGDDDAGFGSGSAYVFHFDGSSWIQEQKLRPGELELIDAFGHAVALAGDLALVSSVGDDDLGTNSGAVYAYHRSGSVWIQDQKFSAGDTEDSDQFGKSVAMDAGLAVIGAPGDDDGGPSTGAACVFRYDGSNWAEEQKLTASDSLPWDTFGRSVAVSGDAIVVGADHTDDAGSRSGTAYSFHSYGSGWVPQWRITASDAAAGAQLGIGVAVDGDRAIVGAEGAARVGGYGQAYAFSVKGLALHTDNNVIPPFGILALDTCGGMPGAGVAMFLVEINGAPMFHYLATGYFDPDGHWLFGATVPAGLGGFVLEFKSIGFVSPSRLAYSNGVTVVFL